jgi:hypothetical protein
MGYRPLASLTDILPGIRMRLRMNGPAHCESRTRCQHLAHWDPTRYGASARRRACVAGPGGHRCLYFPNCSKRYASSGPA